MPPQEPLVSHRRGGLLHHNALSASHNRRRSPLNGFPDRLRPNLLQRLVTLLTLILPNLIRLAPCAIRMDNMHPRRRHRRVKLARHTDNNDIPRRINRDVPALSQLFPSSSQPSTAAAHRPESAERQLQDADA